MDERDQKTRTERVVDHLKERASLKTIASEMGDAIKKQAVLGTYEIGALWTGDAYRGDLGLLTSGAAPDQAQQHGVHGPHEQAEQPASQPPSQPHQPPDQRMQAAINQAMEQQGNSMSNDDPLARARDRGQQAAERGQERERDRTRGR